MTVLSFTGLYEHYIRQTSKWIYFGLFVVMCMCSSSLVLMTTASSSSCSAAFDGAGGSRVTGSTVPSQDVLNLDGSDWASLVLPFNRRNQNGAVEFRTRESSQSMLQIVVQSIPNLMTPMGQLYALVNIYMTNGTMAFHVEHRQTTGGVGSISPSPAGTDQQVHCLSDYQTCADTQWHIVEFELERNMIIFRLDGQLPVRHYLPFTSDKFSIQELHIGRPPAVTHRWGTVFSSSSVIPRKSFRGCLRHMSYTSEGKRHAVYLNGENASDGDLSPQLSRTNIVRRQCSSNLLQSINDPHSVWLISQGQYVTFAKPGGYLRIRGWKIVSTALIQFKLRTVESNALLIYASSVDELDLMGNGKQVVPGNGQAGFDMFALELRDGNLMATINPGSGSVQLTPSNRGSADSSVRLTDSRVHDVSVRFDQGTLDVWVDGRRYMIHQADKNTYKYLNLNGMFYLGGLPNSLRQISSHISPDVWSARLHQDFLGCLGDLRVDNQTWDFSLEMQACWTEGFLHRNCYPPSTRQITTCPQPGCQHGGECRTSWNRYTCDCRQTDFCGETCTDSPLILSFNGHQWLRIQFGPFPIQSAVEHLVIRFHTRQRDGLLFTTHSRSMAASDRLEIRIVSGHLVVFYDFGEDSKKFTNLVRVSDSRWHTVQIFRKERFLNFTVDNSSHVYDIPQDGRFLSHQHIIVGREKHHTEANSLEAFPAIALNETGVEKRYDAFIGHVMRYEFNGVDYLHVAKAMSNLPEYRHWKSRLEITATEGWHQPLLEYPISFEPRNSYVALKVPERSRDFHMTFWVKVNKNFGNLLLFVVGATVPLWGLELENGDIQLVYWTGNSVGRAERKRRPMRVRSGAMTDSKWHQLEVTIKSSVPPNLAVRIDGDSLKATLSNYNVGEQSRTLYIGGIPDLLVNASPSNGDPFHIRPGFSGCIASIQFEQPSGAADYPDLLFPGPNQTTSRSSTRHEGVTDESPLWNHVTAGCRVPRDVTRRVGHCTPRVCQFDGRCVQQLGATRCDCAMTTFTGKYCTDVGTAIRITLTPRTSIVFDLKPPQNTTRDELALGVQINKRGSIIILLIRGQGSSPDFIEVSIVPFQSRHILLVRYNMGGGTYTLYDAEVDIGDGRYHIIQFVRDGPHALLRIDLRHEKRNIATESKHGRRFNDLKRIHFGLPLKPPGGGQSASPLADGIRKRREAQPRFPLPNNQWTDRTAQSGFEGILTGVNFNSINLFQVLQGHVIPGIYLSEKKYLNTLDRFEPKLNHLATLPRSDASVHLTANDMQSQSHGPSATGGPMRQRDYLYTEPLIVPKLDCPDAASIQDPKTCRPNDEDGLIRPIIEFERADNSGGDAVDSRSHKKGWNADQSGPRSVYNGHLDNSDSLLDPQNTKQDADKSHLFTPSNSINPSADQDSNGVDNFNDGGSSSGHRNSNDRNSNSRGSINKGIPVSGLEQFNKLAQQNTGTLARPSTPRAQFAFNIGLIASVSVGGICILLVFVCVIYRCMRRDEGSYNVNENMAYTGEPSVSGQRVAIVAGKRKPEDGPVQLIPLLQTNTGINIPRRLSEDIMGQKQLETKTLLVTFSDSCTHSPVPTPLPTSIAQDSGPLMSPKHSHMQPIAPLSPSSLTSSDSEKRRSQLVKIDPPPPSNLIATMKQTGKTGLKTNGSQEWYV